MITNVQTGTKLSQFDQSLADLQAQLDTPPSYLAPIDPNSKLARGLNTVVNIGMGRQSFSDVAKDYTRGKLAELPQFSKKYEFSEGEQNFSDYSEKLLFAALPLGVALKANEAQRLADLDFKNLISNDVANVIGVPETMKEQLLAGESLSAMGKDYIANKINESPIPINVSKEGDGYKLSKEFDLSSNASLSVSENLRSGRDPNTRVAFDAGTNLGGGRLSAQASKDSGRPARASLGYTRRNEDNNAGFSVSFDKVEGRKPEFKLRFDKKFN